MTSGPDLDDLFDLLRNERRRFVLQKLDEDGPTRLRDIADDLTDRDDLPDRSAYVSLLQIHVPKLIDGHVVRYDEDSGIVSPGPDFDQFARALQAVEDVRTENGRRA